MRAANGSVLTAGYVKRGAHAVDQTGTVSVFAPGATGAATPVQTIAVSAMSSGWGLAVN